MRSIMLFVATLSLLFLTCKCFALDVDEVFAGTTVESLHAQYPNIFKHGNRNAASHLWSSFILERAASMSLETLKVLFSGFCAVSGSPVRPSDYSRYKLRLRHAKDSRWLSGFMHYCCWPCVCDTQDFIKVDTRSVMTLDGPKELMFAVIGNPCDHPEQLEKPFIQPFGFYSTSIAREAAEVRCNQNGKLEGAVMSDHGFVIISLFFDAVVQEPSVVASSPALATPHPGRMSDDNGVVFQDEFEFKNLCKERADAGFNSGMGEIFRRVAAISPINTTSLITNGQKEGESVCDSAIDSS